MSGGVTAGPAHRPQRALATVLPLIVQAAEFARTILDGVGSASGALSRWMTTTAQCLPTDVVAVSMTPQIYDV
jgi:hypothetical protein